jgi:transcriptional antiterminator NusG
VRNTPNVTGFVGSGNIPVPVTPEEYGLIQKRSGGEDLRFKIDFSIGDHVVITGGPFVNYDGIIDKIDPEKGKVKVLVSIFDRETPIELDFTQVKKK